MTILSDQSQDPILPVSDESFEGEMIHHKIQKPVIFYTSWGRVIAPRLILKAHRLGLLDLSG